MKNKNQGKKINGIADVDTPQMEKVRATVVEQELSARSWKALYEKMYYSLEAEKLEPLYNEYQERMQKRFEEQKAQFEAFQKALAEEIEKNNSSDPNGDIKLEEAN